MRQKKNAEVGIACITGDWPAFRSEEPQPVISTKPGRGSTEQHATPVVQDTAKSPTGARPPGGAGQPIALPGPIAPYCREKTTPSHVSLTGSSLLARGLTASTGALSSRAVTGHSRNTTGSGDTSCCNASRRIYLRKHERKKENRDPAWPHPSTAVPMLTPTLPFPSLFSNSIPIPHPTPTMDTRKAAKRQKERNQTTAGVQRRAEERARQRTKQRDARNGYAHAGIIVVETIANY
ncbi:hypothetical protein TcCL_ESM02565 [Trypanosoma cruzi]|nr:hypothetical protein TcCL_ESM02565 [Trypanosoma cruzi]